MLLSAPIASAQTQYLVPGGQSIGVLVQTNGVLITGTAPVTDENGTIQNPAEDSGLSSGDYIISINGQQITSNEDMQQAVNQAGKQGIDCQIQYERQGKADETTVKPVYCQKTDSWRIGLYVRDNTAGVGTLTCYDPDSGFYLALGHMVSGMAGGNDGEAIGSVLRAQVQGLVASTNGNPGEKLGVFIDEGWHGNILQNGSFGISGMLYDLPNNVYSNVPLPLATPGEVETGPALMYTVIDGEKVEAFQINIVKTAITSKTSSWSMIIEVTDERLLEQCGGIVQGMSGSPIIQNGKIIGAVTHVLVNDPTKGYGIFIENMLEAAENGIN